MDPTCCAVNMPLALAFHSASWATMPFVDVTISGGLHLNLFILFACQAPDPLPRGQEGIHLTGISTPS